jgi:arylsulfatase A-like enzyme
MASCIRTGQYKLSYYHNLNIGELYDLQKDPGEVENLWTSNHLKDVRAEMTEKLLARMIGAVDPLPERKSAW